VARAGRPRRRRLQPAVSGSTVYTLGPSLLLVFKPNGHREAVHAHDHGHRLTVVAGVLEVQLERRPSRILRPGDRSLAIAPERRHATRALADTWLVVERQVRLRSQ
jgi:quercetin dioxygenase-like cupin family protein